MGFGKTNISTMVIGQVKSGKSTTTGHLLYKLGCVKPGEIERYEKQAASFKYAWVLDKKAERECGMTINIAIRKFTTLWHDCTIIDAPGHHDYIDNMITGISQADCVVLVIDATSSGFAAGFSEDGQTREHAQLAYTLGVKHMICCCNKMDATTPNYSKERYDGIVEEVSSYLKKVGYDPTKIPFIPISGFEGHNLIGRSNKFTWYKGPTLLQALDEINMPKRPSDNIRSIETDPVGRFETVMIKPGIILSSRPFDLLPKVDSVELYDTFLHRIFQESEQSVE